MSNKNNMIEINQECDCKIKHALKTVEWLIKNTEVRTFNSVNFTGYQRKVNNNHVLELVKYLKKGKFYLPTSIICAGPKNTKITESTKLYIVDGQHRVEAFKKIEKDDKENYRRIKDYEISVIILENPDEKLEIDTFITINKTSRKVDTSLAYILKNKINRNLSNNGSNNLIIAKKEFLAVELAIAINSDENSLWYEKILLEGNPTKKSYETISLNSFVRSTRVLVSYLEKSKIINSDWKDENELRDILDKLKTIYLNIWNNIKIKWPNLFVDQKNNNVIQGAIGVSSINKYIILQLNNWEEKNKDIEIFNTENKNWIDKLDINENRWQKGNEFSRYSSESGFNMIAKILLDAYKK